ncbi:MAG: carboxypeptidase-like regulatory domain-containing protein, partial [Candidatus Micrarchaeota archaeon]|nr:carboxypeptidase-like regulatory domain-containing protein [Candidatus Micrarchaeota archaeon]
IRAKIEIKDKCDNVGFSELVFNTTNLTCVNDAYSTNGWKWNSTVANLWSNLSINITDQDDIYSYVFGLDNGTGTYTYESPVYLSPNTKHLNFSKAVKLNNIVGKSIKFVIIVNDSCNLSKLFSGNFVTTSSCSDVTDFTSWVFNSTYAGKDTLFNITMIDQDNLTGYEFFFDNGSNSFISLGYVPLSNLSSYTVTVVRNINSTINARIRAYVTANDSCGNLVNSSILEFNTTQQCENNMTFSNWSVNTTYADTDANFSISVNDSDGIKSYIFWFDNGFGSYTADPEVNLSSTPISFNFSIIKHLNSNEGSTIRAILTVKDNCSNIYNSTELIFNTTYKCPLIITNSKNLVTSVICPTTAVIINNSNVALNCLNNSIEFGYAGQGYGIQAVNKSNITIRNCIVLTRNNASSVDDIGIDVSNSSNITINSTRINLNGTIIKGISANNVSNFRLHSSNLSANVTTPAFELLNSSNIVISSNYLDGAINLSNVSLINISNNTIFSVFSTAWSVRLEYFFILSTFLFDNNKVSRRGFVISPCYNCTFLFNEINETSRPLRIDNTTNLKVVGNKFHGKNQGLLLYNATGSLVNISDNYGLAISGVHPAISINDANNLYLVNNTGNSQCTIAGVLLSNVKNSTVVRLIGISPESDTCVYEGYPYETDYAIILYNIYNLTLNDSISYGGLKIDSFSPEQNSSFLVAHNFTSTNVSGNKKALFIKSLYNSSFNNLTLTNNLSQTLFIYTASNITISNSTIINYDVYEGDPLSPTYMRAPSRNIVMQNVSNITFRNIRLNRTFNGYVSPSGCNSFFLTCPYFISFEKVGLSNITPNRIIFDQVEFNHSINQILFTGNNLHTSGDHYIINSTTFVNNSLRFDTQNRTDNITAQWYIRVNVTNESNNPVNGATVSLKNNLGITVSLGTTDSTGLTQWYLINDTTYTNEDIFPNTVIRYNPQNLTVSAPGYSTNVSTVIINTTGTINVILKRPISCPFSAVFTNLSHNSTYAGSSVNFSVSAYDEDNITSYQFCIANGSGVDFVCDGWTSVSNLTNLSASVIKSINSTTGTTISYYFRVRDICNNIVTSSIQSFDTTLSCTNNASYGDWSYNSTYAGTDVNFSIQVNDSDVIKKYRFSIDNGTGQFIHDAIQSYNSNQLNFSIVKRINSTVNSQIRFMLHTWDSCDISSFNEGTFITTYLCSNSPVFSSWAWNSTVNGSDVNISINVSDLDNITSYRLWFDNGTGVYVADSWVSNSPVDNDVNFSIVRRVNSTCGSSIRFILEVNDSCGNRVNSSVGSFTTTCGGLEVGNLRCILGLDPSLPGGEDGEVWYLEPFSYQKYNGTSSIYTQVGINPSKRGYLQFNTSYIPLNMHTIKNLSLSLVTNTVVGLPLLHLFNFSQKPSSYVSFMHLYNDSGNHTYYGNVSYLELAYYNNPIYLNQTVIDELLGLLPQGWFALGITNTNLSSNYAIYGFNSSESGYSWSPRLIVEYNTTNNNCNITLPACKNPSLFSDWFWNSTANGSSVNLLINLSDLDGIDSYELYLDNGTGTYLLRDSKNDILQNQMIISYVFNVNRSCGSWIRFRLKVMDDCGNSTWSTEGQFLTTCSGKIICVSSLDTNMSVGNDGHVHSNGTAFFFNNLSSNLRANSSYTSYGGDSSVIFMKFPTYIISNRIENVLSANLTINVTGATNYLSYCEIKDFSSDPDVSSNMSIYDDAVSGVSYGIFSTCTTRGLKVLNLTHPNFVHDFKRYHLLNGWFGLGIKIPFMSPTASTTNALSVSSAEGNYVPSLTIAYYTTDNTCP